MSELAKSATDPSRFTKEGWNERLHPRDVHGRFAIHQVKPSGGRFTQPDRRSNDLLHLSQESAARRDDTVVVGRVEDVPVGAHVTHRDPVTGLEITRGPITRHDQLSGQTHITPNGGGPDRVPFGSTVEITGVPNPAVTPELTPGPNAPQPAAPRENPHGIQSYSPKTGPNAEQRAANARVMHGDRGPAKIGLYEVSEDEENPGTWWVTGGPSDGTAENAPSRAAAVALAQRFHDEDMKVDAVTARENFTAAVRGPITHGGPHGWRDAQRLRQKPRVAVLPTRKNVNPFTGAGGIHEGDQGLTHIVVANEAGNPTSTIRVVTSSGDMTSMQVGDTVHLGHDQGGHALTGYRGGQVIGIKRPGRAPVGNVPNRKLPQAVFK